MHSQLSLFGWLPCCCQFSSLLLLLLDNYCYWYCVKERVQVSIIIIYALMLGTALSQRLLVDPFSLLLQEFCTKLGRIFVPLFFITTFIFCIYCNILDSKSSRALTLIHTFYGFLHFKFQIFGLQRSDFAVVH